MNCMGISKVGLVRKQNEDRFVIKDNLCIITDGMGGYAGGEIASTYAIDEIQRQLKDVSPLSTEALVKAVKEANAKICATVGQEPALEGMGTTAVIAALEGQTLYWAHVGDSRLYVFRHGNLEQVTTDHSFVQTLFDAGEITREEMGTHPKRNMLTRAVGVGQDVEVDSGTIELMPGDRILLCTDGLTEYVSDYIIEGVLDELDSNEEVLDVLIRLVYDSGAGDNTTIIVGTV
ncbi:MAG: Stp1/IreP family PP2C-type Ser/Thr phosphatase [Veillonella sp.]|nr:Stp1/IreP family PP2C-type Ser/Thr phosphatase [Veillonella sp.]MCF0155821.1 Stp1/IreP family PP2C-type Ser/Thr phosphatase [Veillonella sp.]